MFMSQGHRWDPINGIKWSSEKKDSCSPNLITKFPDKSKGGAHNCWSGLQASAPENIWAPQTSQQEQAAHGQYQLKYFSKPGIILFFWSEDHKHVPYKLSCFKKKVFPNECSLKEDRVLGC